jgi:CMP-N,N'-diacetyllegionaminic acid synthase
MSMNVLGVILARAGSEGLPNKHLLPLLGKPVIAYTFEHAKLATRLGGVVVTTDCPEIAGLARAAGLMALDRPPELATADATVQDVMLHAMQSLEMQSDFRADALVVLYGNVPVRGEGIIDRAVEMLEQSGCDSVRSVCPVGKWHPAWMSRLNGDRMEALQPGSIDRRQNLDPLFLHDGAVVAVTRASMLRGLTQGDNPHAFFGDDRRGVQTEIGETVEIDHLRDLYWAEATLRARQGAAEREARSQAPLKMSVFAAGQPILAEAG